MRIQRRGTCRCCRRRPASGGSRRSFGRRRGLLLLAVTDHERRVEIDYQARQGPLGRLRRREHLAGQLGPLSPHHLTRRRAELGRPRSAERGPAGRAAANSRVRRHRTEQLGLIGQHCDIEIVVAPSATATEAQSFCYWGTFVYSETDTPTRARRAGANNDGKVASCSGAFPSVHGMSKFSLFRYPRAV